MSKASTHCSKLRRPESTFDICAMLPILACAYPVIIAPLIYFAFPPAGGLQGLMESRTENRIFWPAVAAISVVLAVRNWSRLGRLTLPPNIICLLAYLAFAGASVSWAFNAELSFTRFVQEVMVLTSIVLPAMLAVRTADMMRGMFLCFAFASVVNVFFLRSGLATIATYGSVQVNIGYQGYFTQKNILGEFAAIALLLSLYELLHPGRRRAFGIMVGVVATSLLFLSNSKTALGLALFAPLLAGLTLIIGKRIRVSQAIILLSIPFCYAVLSSVSNFNIDRLSYMIYGDSTLTGRTIIWDFAQYEIARRPLLGWGYQSFWLVGSDAPSIVDASGWLKGMPNAHNGYYDTMLEMGYVGLAFLIIFIIVTLHVIGRVAERDPARAWLLLSIVLFIVIYNFLETLWMRAFDLLWVVFVIAAAEAARHWQPSLLTRPAYGWRPARPASSSSVRGARKPRPGDPNFCEPSLRPVIGKHFRSGRPVNEFKPRQ